MVEPVVDDRAAQNMTRPGRLAGSGSARTRTQNLPTRRVEEYEAELEQKLAEAEAQAAAEEEQAERDRAERAARYDPQRAQARLVLLEEQGILADKVRERDEIISRDLFPLIDDSLRDSHLAALEPVIAAG